MLTVILNTVINVVCSFTVGYFIGLGILKFAPYLYRGIKSKL